MSGGGDTAASGDARSLTALLCGQGCVKRPFLAAAMRPKSQVEVSARFRCRAPAPAPCYDDTKILERLRVEETHCLCRLPSEQSPLDDGPPRDRLRACVSLALRRALAAVGCVLTGGVGHRWAIVARHARALRRPPSAAAASFGEADDRSFVAAARDNGSCRWPRSPAHVPRGYPRGTYCWCMCTRVSARPCSAQISMLQLRLMKQAPKMHGDLCEMTLAFTARPTIPCTGAPSAGAYFIARSPGNLVLVEVLDEHVSFSRVVAAVL